MITKNQIMAKLADMTEYCTTHGYEGGDYAGYISALNPVIDSYFGGSSPELKEAVRTLITHLYGDLLLRDQSFEKPVGPAIPTNYPPGYSDLTSLFDGNGVLTEILNMDAEEFMQGFPVETVMDETGGSSIIVLTNPIIAVWTEKLNSAHSAEVSKIQNINAWIEEYSFGRELISLFEDRGKVTMTKGKTDFAKNIYIDMKVKEVIETFGLDVWIPTYLR